MRLPALRRTLKQGLTGIDVRWVQEWLTLHGINVAIDGDFGPASDAAVRRFQKKQDLTVDGTVGPRTFAALIAPLTRATSAIDPGKRSLGRVIVACARQHLREWPREVGGQNRGPWVRLYMDGNQGPEWPWCAGFATYVLHQASEAAGVAMPVTRTFSCDLLAASAKASGVFLAEKDASPDLIGAGSFFLNRRTSDDWVHTGIVVKANEEVCETIEGNTNDDGSRDGYEVCRRFRGYARMDFVLL